MYFSLANNVENTIKRNKANCKKEDPVEMTGREKRKQITKKRRSILKSKRWLDIRLKAIERDGKVCKICGKDVDGVDLHVDHIKPRLRYPELTFDLNNLQVLCRECNFKKGLSNE